MSTNHACGVSIQTNMASLHDYDFDSFEQLHGDLAPVTNMVTEWLSPAGTKPITPLKKRRKKQKENQLYDKKLMYSPNEGLWQESVEKYSYRYISNNGCYRRIKQQANQPRQSFSQRKPSVTSGVSINTQEHKALQRELTRDLRREFQSLMETNRGYFRIQDSEVEQLEDEEDYKSRHKMASVSEEPDEEPDLSVPDFLKVVPPAARLQDSVRILESQSAQPAGRLEDLMIDKRSRSTMDYDSENKQNKDNDRLSIDSRLLTDTYPMTSHHDKSSGDPLQKRSYPSLQTNFQYVNKEQFELLAKNTFNFRRSSDEEKMLKTLKPVEKITPALREHYDNSKAVDEMMKMGYAPTKPKKSYPDINITSVMPLNPRSKEQYAELEGVGKSKKSSNIKTFSSMKNVGGAKLGETKSKCSIMKRVTVNLDQEPEDDFQSFLPSISGKRITSKLASTIKLSHHIHH